MSHYENINRIFDALITDPSSFDQASFSPFMDLFPLLTREEQKEFAQTFYGWAEEKGHSYPLSFCYARCVLALHYFYSEQYDALLPLVTETKQLFAAQNDQNGVAVCLTLLGNTYRTLGNVDLALKALWESYRHLKKTASHKHFLMACCHQIGSIYSEMRHYEQSVPLFKSTLEMAEMAQNYFWEIYAMLGLAKVYLQQEKYADAKAFLEKAGIAAEKNKNPVLISNVLTELADYYFAMGDYSVSEQLHLNALALREQHHLTGGAVTNCIHIGEMYIRQSKPEAAIDVLQKGLKMAEQINVKPKLYQIHFLLSEIYKGKKVLNKCLLHYKLFHEIREQVEWEDSAKKLKNAQLIFEAEQTQKENIIIKQQKAEIEKKNFELQETIDELTRTKIGKKAKAFTIMIAIVMFIFEDSILHFALSIISTDNYYFTLLVKMVIIFSLSPINKAIEKHLLKRVMPHKTRPFQVHSSESGLAPHESPVYLPSLSQVNI